VDSVDNRKYNKQAEEIRFMKHNFSEEEKECLRHALMHLEENKIIENLGYGSWYCGNRKQFIARHKKALAVLRGFLGQTDARNEATNEISSQRDNG
jgi:hypothetical protein